MFPLRASSTWTWMKEKNSFFEEISPGTLEVKGGHVVCSFCVEAATPLTSIHITARSKIMCAVTFNQSNIQPQLKVKSKVCSMLCFAHSQVRLEPHHVETDLSRRLA